MRGGEADAKYTLTWSGVIDDTGKRFVSIRCDVCGQYFGTARQVYDHLPDNFSANLDGPKLVCPGVEEEGE